MKEAIAQQSQVEQKAREVIEKLISAAFDESAFYLAARVQLVEHKSVFATVKGRCVKVLAALKSCSESFAGFASELDAAEKSIRAPRAQRDAFDTVLKVCMCDSHIPPAYSIP